MQSSFYHNDSHPRSIKINSAETHQVGATPAFIMPKANNMESGMAEARSSLHADCRGTQHKDHDQRSFNKICFNCIDSTLYERYDPKASISTSVGSDFGSFPFVSPVHDFRTVGSLQHHYDAAYNFLLTVISNRTVSYGITQPDFCHITHQHRNIANGLYHNVANIFYRGYSPIPLIK